MVAKKAAGKTVLDKVMTKSQIVAEIAESVSLTKKDVEAVFAKLEDLVAMHINKKSVGQFVLPGLLKVYTTEVPARKAEKNQPKPFCPGEFYDIPAKPAYTKVKVRALKKLKDMAS